MVLHFFRERIKERIDFSDVLDVFFGEIDNCEITSDDDQVDIEITEPCFDFKYHFYITKRTRVTNIIKLNPSFVNTNILIEIPVLLPKFLVRKILKIVGDLCRRFELSIYHDLIEDIAPFSMLDLLSYIDKETYLYKESHPQKYYYLDQRTLTTACTYLQVIPEIAESMVVDTVMSPYDVLYDKEDDKVCLSVSWQAGQPTVFPPLLDYVFVEEEGNLLSVIPADTFFKYTRRLMHEVLKNKKYDYELDMELYYLNEKNAVKAKKLIRKMRKHVVLRNRFNTLKITDILEKTGDKDE